MPGGMRMMSTFVYLIIFFNLLRIKNSTSICSSSRSAATVTTKVLLGPKTIYLMYARRAFNSNTDGFSMDVLVGDVSRFSKSN